MIIPSDRFRFPCTVDGRTSTYLLGSLSDHAKAGLVESGTYLIFHDSLIRHEKVPRNQVRIIDSRPTFAAQF
jgi:hypothetical protein